MSGSFGPSGGSSNLSSPTSIGNITPNTISATDITNSARIVSIPSATQTLIATSSIACTAGLVPITSASNITLTSNPQISTGLNGQKITLVNTGSFAITLIVGKVNDSVQDISNSLRGNLEKTNNKKIRIIKKSQFI